MKRKAFVDDFYIKQIINMKKEDYVVGMRRRDTFGYRLETELQELGDIHGSTALKFGMYYGKSGEGTEQRYRIVESKFGQDPDEALEEIKREIVSLIIAGSNLDYNRIKESKLAPIFRGKILSIYFPQDFLSIFAREHLEFFLGKLGIDFTNKDDEFDKQLKLIDWKKNHSVTLEWSMFTFNRFLYETFGNPSHLSSFKNEQKERDENYPREYVVKLGITIKQWKELIKDKKVFSEKDIELMKRFYLSENHAATCYDLGMEDNLSPSSYIFPVVHLAKKISKALQMKPLTREDGKEVWWRVPFWGRYREDGRFEWKLRPELAEALARVYTELDRIEIAKVEDDKLINDLRKWVIEKDEKNSTYSNTPRKRKDPIFLNGQKVYPRDRKVSLNALAHADYQCEIDAEHPSFIRKKSDVNYTEPHHLIPMAYTEQFKVSLDVEENIVSLCSNCHNQLHYGKSSEDLIRKLYSLRKEMLIKVGLDISLKRLLSMYS